MKLLHFTSETNVEDETPATENLGELKTNGHIVTISTNLKTKCLHQNSGAPSLAGRQEGGQKKNKSLETLTESGLLFRTDDRPTRPRLNRPDVRRAADRVGQFVPYDVCLEVKM